MNIKIRLYLSAGISIILVGILFSAVLITTNSITEQNKKHDLLNAVEDAVSGLDIVAYEYLLHHEKRMEQQWRSKYASMAKILQKEELQGLQTNYNALGKLFSQLVKIQGNKQQLIKEGVSQEVIGISLLQEERLAAQLLIKSHLLLTEASRLAEEADETIKEAQELATNLALILMSILAITVLSSSIIVSRSISKPLDKLTQGAKRIGKGDLDHRVEVKTKDELGKLAETFNIMMDNLKKITASRDELDKEVAERKKAQEELMAANERLKGLDKLKSMFIASMSHELRTPLNSIIGFTGIILKGLAGEINEEQQKQLSMVQSSAKHLLALINDVIDVSKIEAEKVQLSIEEFEFSKEMQEIKESFSVMVAEKGINLTLEMPEGIKVKSDERRLKQVIMNLVSNAIKFTSQGGVNIKVVPAGGKVNVFVEDTGTGIRKEDIDKLFKQFSRIVVEGLPLVEGTGLGLYLSQKLAHLLGGEIVAESKFGEGSKFTFTFPSGLKEVGI